MAKEVLCKTCGSTFLRETGRKMYCSVRCSFEDKFLKKLDDECWPWTASKCSKKYGTFWDGARVESAHRQAWIFANGPLPAGAHVLHRCDNPTCVNPAHLFLGDNADNVRDKVSKGRAKGLKGEAHPNSKLTESDVRMIRMRLASGETCISIAKAFGVTDVLISYIKLGKAWSHVKF